MRQFLKAFTNKALLSACVFSLGSGLMPTLASSPDEGMWLPMLIKRLNHEDMQKKGLKLTADELYNANQASLKDAIVSLGGFCTGEIISPEGLLLTNHHCGYDAIQSHSSVEKDYLGNGFWAMKRSEELPNKGLFVTFLIRMEDVTSQALEGVNASMGEAERRAAIAKNVRAIEQKAEAAEAAFGYKASVRPFFDGNQYILFINQVYEDVRLVGAPPSSIGKFGGDTDNWMWPRHTGDFSMFRVYMSPDGKPAKYSPNNVPLKPRHYLPISLNGVKEGDFTMIFGYPGRTNRYLTSWGVNLELEVSHPTSISIRERKLGIMKKQMDADKAVHIMYASKYAQISNYWKYFIGQSQGLKRLKVVDKKRAEEAEFDAWVKADPTRQQEYGNVLTQMADSYDKLKKYRAASIVSREWLSNGPAFLTPAILASRYAESLKNKDAKPEQREELKNAVLGTLEDVYKEFNYPIEEQLTALHMKAFTEFCPEDQWPEEVKRVKNKMKGDFDKFASEAFKKSAFTNAEKIKALLYAADPKKIESDPLVVVASDFLSNNQKNITPPSAAANAQLEKANRLYVAGTMLMKPDKKFYPNANSTMRMTYGQVLAYEPKDGVTYQYLTSLDGIMEKEDPTNEEFIVPAKLKELFKAKDFGDYAENGKVPCSFISNNDITGGNSGSPVINANGELIGTAYDGNWEAMSGDIAFEPKYQRTISVDIRYTLFIIDKYAGAKHLVDEMKLVKHMPELKAPPASIDLPKVTVPPLTAPVAQSVKSTAKNAKQAAVKKAAALKK